MSSVVFLPRCAGVVSVALDAKVASISYADSGLQGRVFQASPSVQGLSGLSSARLSAHPSILGSILVTGSCLTPLGKVSSQRDFPVPQFSLGPRKGRRVFVLRGTSWRGHVSIASGLHVLIPLCA